MAIFNQVVSGGSSAPAGLSIPLKVNQGLLRNDYTASTSLDFTGVVVVGAMLQNAYMGNSTITGVAFRNGSSIQTINANTCGNMYNSCVGITSIGLTSSLQYVQDHGLEFCFNGCTGITSVGTMLSGIENIGAYALAGCFVGCSNLTGNISFDSLTTLSAPACLTMAFMGTSVNSISFPALEYVDPDMPSDIDPEMWDENGNDIFNGMLSGVTGCTVHFPSNLENRINQFYDYANGFGGTNTTILFDLDPTGEPYEPEPEEPEEPEEPMEE